MAMTPAQLRRGVLLPLAALGQGLAGRPELYGLAVADWSLSGFSGVDVRGAALLVQAFQEAAAGAGGREVGPAVVQVRAGLGGGGRAGAHRPPKWSLSLNANIAISQYAWQPRA